MNLNNFKNTFVFKLICFFLIFSMLPWSCFSPTTVKADKTSGHDTYFIETLIGTSDYMPRGTVDRSTVGKSKEEKMIKDISSRQDDRTKEYIDWSVYSMKTNPFDMGVELQLKEDVKLDDNTGLIFSFPSYQRNIGDNYQKDFDRGSNILQTLTKNLNSTIKAVKDSIDYDSQYLNEASLDTMRADLIYISRKINPKSGSDAGDFRKVSLGSIEIFYAKADKYQTYMDNVRSVGGSLSVGGKTFEVPVIDDNGNLLMYIVDSSQNIKRGDLNGLVWAMPKGYLNPVDGKAIKVSDSVNGKWGVANPNAADGKGDAIWITMFTLAEYANAQAQFNNYGAMDAAANGLDFIGDAIYGLLWGIISGIMELLQLDSIPDLIYGSGGMNNYGQGLMNKSWWNVVLKYHLIFQIVAWMMLIVAVAKILLQVNFSTINPNTRISIMDTAQKLLIVGFSLGLCIPFIRMLGDVNGLIVNLFATQGVDEGNFFSGFGIAGLVIMLGYIGITFTLNCIYIMRSIMIAILTASAPLFITSMAFTGPRQKGLFDNWLKEISANIFMQSIHAFAFAFLFDVMGSSKVLVRLVIYFSLLPIVDATRQLVFGQSGTFAVSQGQKAAQTVGAFAGQTVGGVAKGAGNAALGAFMKGKSLDTKGTANPESSGGNTPGEERAAAVGSNLKSNVQNLASALKNGEIQRNDKKPTSQTQRTLQKGLGHALSGASKAADLYKSSGGIMGNAVTQANLGNVGDSISASKSYGEGVAKHTEQSAHDAANLVEGGLERYYQGKLKESTNDFNAANQAINEAENSINHNTMLKNKATNLKKPGDLENKFQEKIDRAQVDKDRAQADKDTAKASVIKYQNKLEKQAKRRGIAVSANNNLKTASNYVKEEGGIGWLHENAYKQMSSEQKRKLGINDYENLEKKDGWIKVGGNVVDGNNGQSMISGIQQYQNNVNRNSNYGDSGSSGVDNSNINFNSGAGDDGIKKTAVLEMME